MKLAALPTSPTMMVIKPPQQKKATNKRCRPEEVSSDEDEVSAVPKKSVRWSTVTVYEFGVTIGGSAVPRRGGPSIGLSRKLKNTWSAMLDDIEFDPPTIDDDSSLANTQDGSNKRLRRTVSPRQHRVRWFKPQERVQLLTKAGCSEKRIYRTMMESSEIAMSRRLCVAAQYDGTLC